MVVIVHQLPYGPDSFKRGMIQVCEYYVVCCVTPSVESVYTRSALVTNKVHLYSDNLTAQSNKLVAIGVCRCRTDCYSAVYKQWTRGSSA